MKAILLRGILVGTKKKVEMIAWVEGVELSQSLNIQYTDIEGDPNIFNDIMNGLANISKWFLSNKENWVLRSTPDMILNSRVIQIFSLIS